MKFLRCEKSGTIIEVVNDRGVAIECGGEKMLELVPNSTEAAGEKHIPIYKVEGNKVEVTVGEVLHPMEKEHFIEWVVLETKEGCQRKRLKAGDSVKVSFALSDSDELKGVYAYCNLHGLWQGK